MLQKRDNSGDSMNMSDVLTRSPRMSEYVQGCASVYKVCVCSYVCMYVQGCASVYKVCVCMYVCMYVQGCASVYKV